MLFNFNICDLFSQNKSVKIERIAQRLIRRNKIPGMSISVIKDDTLIFSKGFGYANLKLKTPINPKSTLFRIGSVSKPISAIALAKAVLDKKIDLDISVYNYLPDFPKKKYDFSIRQLGANIAGIRSYRGREFLNKAPLTIAQGIDIFKDDKLIYQPGTKCVYTSYGWNLISYILTKQLTHPFDQYVQTEVLLPMGLYSTVPDYNQVFPEKALCYRKNILGKFSETTKVDHRHKLASGGFLSTSEDVANFGNALLNNTFIPKTLQDQFTRSVVIDGKKTYYGIGFESSYDHKGRAYFGHTGNALGGYAIFRVYPEENLVVSILINCSNPKQNKLLNRLVDAVFKTDFKK